MTWGNWGKNLDTKEMIALMETCISQQITTFDHADIYGAHTTEAAFGEAFLQSGIKRENIQLISKCGIKYVAENRTYTIKHYDYSASHIIWSVENSLRNLKTDYLDVLLLHRPSPLLNVEEVVTAMHSLTKQGKIKEFGVSNFTPSQMELIQKHLPIAYNQIAFSATNFTPMLDGTLDYMQVNNIQPMAWNPLGSFFKETNEQNSRIQKVLSEIKEKYQASEDVLLLSWILQHPAKIVPVIGTTNPERVKATAKASTIFLELEDWFAIWTASMGNKVP